MPMTMHVHIVSAEEEIYSGTVCQVHAPAVMGEVGIYPRHTQLLTQLKPGEIRIIKENGETDFYFVSGGILEVQPHVVTVLADTALRAKDVDEEAAQQAKERAMQVLQEAGNNTEVDIARAEADYAEAMAQLRIAQHLKRKLNRQLDV